jgi:hypothetical protein
LFVSHFFKDDAYVHCFTCIDVQCRQLCFCCRGHDVFDDVRYVEDGTIVWWDFSIVGEEKMSTCTASGIGHWAR